MLVNKAAIRHEVCTSGTENGTRNQRELRRKTMQRLRSKQIFRSKVLVGALAAAAGLFATTAWAADKVKVGMFPVSSSLPFYVALDLGYFKEVNIEPEVTKLMGGPPNVAALITNQIEVSAVLVTLEGLNANLKKPGVAVYVAMHSQNQTYKMEQFVVRNGLNVTSLKDFKGLKLMSAPGPA